ncbi:MAG: hypothetical protein RML72_03470, partial [Bacteroidia bacterium]|nr:hypothetical protein [Bacteroidia bacterium]
MKSNFTPSLATQIKISFYLVCLLLYCISKAYGTSSLLAGVPTSKFGVFCKVKFSDQEQLLKANFGEKSSNPDPYYQQIDQVREYIRLLQYYLPENAVLFQVYSADPSKIDIFSRWMSSLRGFEEIEWLSLSELNFLSQKQWEQTLIDTTQALQLINKPKLPFEETPNNRLLVEKPKKSLDPYNQVINSCPNVYTKVTAINLCNNSVTVSSTNGFSVGDKVLLIQMKGAAIDQSNSTNYGNITSYNSAGNYEFQIIASISGSTITFQHQLVRTYDPNHFVQLVKVGTYTNATTQGTITCPAWNATTGTGGVLVIEASGTLTLGGTIHMNGAGFRGGVTNPNQDFGPCGTSSFFLPSTTTDASEKGEGIAHWIVNQEFARGKLANGGGGGNAHNCGGGGGGNMGMGGIGGYWSGCALPNQGGIGGINLVYNNVQNKIFLGGGGGGGHQNNSVGANGGRGGGIIIIKANSLVSTNNSIQANGQDGFNTPWPGNDGAGGGGAGGTILLNVASYAGVLNVNVNGGKGGNACCTHGPGGGGGGGIVWSSSALPANVIVTATPGVNGVELNWNSAMQATPGQAGGVLTGLSMPQGSVPFVQQAVSVTPTTTAYCQGGSVTLSSSYTQCTGCQGINY